MVQNFTVQNPFLGRDIIVSPVTAGGVFEAVERRRHLGGFSVPTTDGGLNNSTKPCRIGSAHHTLTRVEKGARGLS